jgi:diguanylate cyclase (GGDEF)-like protein/PAS domain S-box-containing protein
MLIGERPQDSEGRVPHSMAESSITDEQMFRIVSRYVGATISVYDRDLVFRYVSEGFAGWFGLQPAQIVGRTLAECYGEHNFTRYRPYIDRALAGETVAYERQVRDPSGFDGWRTVSLVPWRDDHGNIVGVVNSALSVHELKTTTEALRAANQRLTSHMDNSPLAVIEFSPQLDVTRWSPRAEKMFGWVLDSTPDMNLALLLGLDDGDNNSLRLAFARLQDGQETNNRVETRHARSNGAIIHCEWFNSALTDEKGEVTSIMSLVQDVSERVEMVAQMRDLAEHDSLTGLLNRSAFRLQMERALRRARNTQELVALLFIDLDGFKQVNDRLGHAAGDEVLRVVARRMSSSVRAADIVARLGGDEFVVLLESPVDASIAEEVSSRILAALTEDYSFLRRAESGLGDSVELPKVGASIGVALYTPQESHVDSLFKRADAAMYDAKRSGKGCIRVAIPGE